MSAEDELRAEVERLRAESEDRRRHLLATLQRENEVRRDLAHLRGQIEALADTKPGATGRALRALLAGSGEQPGEDHEPDLPDGVLDDEGKALPAGLCYVCQQPEEAHRPAPEVPDSPDVRERVWRALADAVVQLAEVPRGRLGEVLDDLTDAVLAVVGQGVTAEPVAVVERIHEDRPVITARVYAPELWAHLEPGTHLRAVVRSDEKEG